MSDSLFDRAARIDKLNATLERWKPKEYFKLTPQSFTALREALHANKTPDDIIEALQPLENVLFNDSRDFYHAVYTCLDKNRVDRWVKDLIWKYGSYEWMVFLHEICDALPKRADERASTCQFCCRHLPNSAALEGSTSATFPSAFNSLQQVSEESGKEGYDVDCLLQCPHCGLCYKYMIYEVRTVDYGYTVRAYTRLDHPLHVAESYLRVLQQEYAGVTWGGLAIVPQRPESLLIEVRHAEPADEFHDFARVWAEYLRNRLEYTQIVCKFLPQEETPRLSGEDDASVSSRQMRYVVDVKEIGRLFYGGYRKPFHVDDLHGKRVVLEIPSISKISIRRDACSLLRVVVKTVDGGRYVGTLRQ